MSASEAGSSDSIARTSPTAICFIASRVLTIGIGQNRPVQSICLSGLTSLDSTTIAGYRTSAVGAPSRKVPEGPGAPAADPRGSPGDKFPHRHNPEAAIFWIAVLHAT